jgi:hypothetical protein
MNYNALLPDRTAMGWEWDIFKPGFGASTIYFQQQQ